MTIPRMTPEDELLEEQANRRHQLYKLSKWQFLIVRVVVHYLLWSGEVKKIIQKFRESLTFKLTKRNI